jgi:hypothetical protein
MNLVLMQVILTTKSKTANSLSLVGDSLGNRGVFLYLTKLKTSSILDVMLSNDVITETLFYLLVYISMMERENINGID